MPGEHFYDYIIVSAVGRYSLGTKQADSMEISGGRHVLTPNAWCADTELYVATVRVGGSQAESGIGTTVVRVDAVLPQRRELFGEFQAPDSGEDPSPITGWATLLGQITLTLQSRARPPATTFLRVAPTGEPHQIRIVIACHDPVLVEGCLAEALKLVRKAQSGDLEDLTPLVDRLTVLADDVCVGPGTMMIVRAAVARGVPWRRLGRECMVQLGHGVRQRRIWTAVTDRTSSIAEGIAVNKQLTKDVLAAAGVPVPRGRVVSSAAEAWQAALAVGLPVVVKPTDGNHGRGVFLNLSARDDVERAFPVASKEGRRVKTVLVERFIPGFEHRLLVIGGRMVACAKGEHLSVTGDGHHSIAELIALQINTDPRRGRSEAMPNKPVDLDATVLAQLEQEGVVPQTVLPAGRRVLVKRIGTHGLDVTAAVHPEMAALAVRAARAVGLDIAGIDLIAWDIDRPPREQGAAVCEVNAGPQLMIHAKPSHGPGQPVAERIVEHLFSTGAPGRIPIAVILAFGPESASGTGGATPATRTALLLERMLSAAGGTPGLACGMGTRLAGCECSAEPAVGTDAARDLLVSPDIDAAVCELDWRSLADRGLPFDACDVLVLGRLPSAEHEAVDSSIDASPVAVCKALIATVASTGTIVLVDADDTVAGLAARSGRAVVAVESMQEPAAAVAAALGLSADAIHRALADFRGSTPGIS